MDDRIKTMGKILNYIQDRGKGKYTCYSTKKVSLDTSESEIFEYDDKPILSDKAGKIAETDKSKFKEKRIPESFLKIDSVFSYFLDGSRHVYKVDDILIGDQVFPVLAGQIIVGCCERRDRDTFKPYKYNHSLVMAMPDNFDLDDDGVNFCKSICEGINSSIESSNVSKILGIKMNKLLLYKQQSNDPNDKDKYKNSATAKIQYEMMDEEQRMVADLCKNNKLDGSHYLIKDGSLQYNPGYSNMSKNDFLLMRNNYRYVVGVSKSFNPELLKDYEGDKLSKTIANLSPLHRTKVYRYSQSEDKGEYAVWYLRLRNNDFRPSNFSDIVKCEMIITREGGDINSDEVDMISASLLKEAYPVCFGNDERWANHLYPVYLTESFCKSKYYSKEVVLNLF